jgi:hypothetical protein
VKWTEVKLVEASEWEYNQAAHEPLEDRHSPLSLRSKAEHLTRHQPIKVLSTFKHQEVAPLSSSFVHVSSEKKKVVVSMLGKHCYNPKLKNGIKSQKSRFKLVHDMLIKKWIFVKAQKQLDDLTIKPFNVCNLEDIKKVSEVALFMEAIRMLAEASKKNKKRGDNHKPESTKS